MKCVSECGLLRGWALAVISAGAMLGFASAARAADGGDATPLKFVPWSGVIAAENTNLVIGTEVLTTLKRGEAVSVIAREGGWLGVAYRRRGPAGKPLMDKDTCGWVLAKDVTGGPPGGTEAAEPGPPPDSVPVERMPVRIEWKGGFTSAKIHDVPDIVCIRSQAADVKEAQFVAEVGVTRTAKGMWQKSDVFRIEVPRAEGRLSAEDYLVRMGKAPEGASEVPLVARLRFSPAVSLRDDSTVLNSADWRSSAGSLIMARDKVGFAIPSVGGTAQFRLALFVPRDAKSAERVDAGERVSNWLEMAVWVADPTPEQALAEHHSRAKGFLRAKNYKEAVEEYEKVLDANPKDVEALYNSACACALIGDKVRAMAFLRGAVDAGWTDFDALEHDHDLDALRAEPRYREVLKAVCEQAIRESEKNLAAEPANEGVLYALARAYAMLGERGKAMDSLKKAVAAGWSDYDRLEADSALDGVRADTEYKGVLRGSCENSAKACEKTLAADPKSVSALYNGACAYSLLGDGRKAIALLQRAVEAGWGDFRRLEKSPLLKAVREEPGYKALDEKARETRCRKDLEAYLRALNANPANAAAAYNVACGYALLGDKAKALEYLKKAIEGGWYDFYHMEKDSDLNGIRAEGGYKELLKEACRKGIPMYENVAADNPGYALSLYKALRGCAIVDDKERGDALRKQMDESCRATIAASEKAVEAMPDDAAAFYAAARAHALLGEKEKTLAALKRAADAGWFQITVVRGGFATVGTTMDDAFDGVRGEPGYDGVFRKICDNGLKAYLTVDRQDRAYVVALYNTACQYSLLGDKAKALEYLKKAFENGFDGFDTIAVDTDLDAIRYESGFETLLRAYRGKARRGGGGDELDEE